MAKHRKTKEQKIAASQKRDLNQFAYSFTNLSEDKKTNPVIHHPKTTSYSYVYNDLKKTLTVCAIVIAFQLFLFFILQHHIFMIPGVSY